MYNPYKLDKISAERILRRAFLFTYIDYSIYRITESGQIVLTTKLTTENKCVYKYNHTPVYPISYNKGDNNGEEIKYVIFKDMLMNEYEWYCYLLYNVNMIPANYI